ncbi:DUF29 domain-containing protein, partial [Lamprobacter modestohalophilus]|uniref:DUF29 domain-containing protein n=1 Tax=Lamprobacter modestohalophilus TaxID=1064514 RepID=UPI002ADEAAAD
ERLMPTARTQVWSHQKTISQATYAHDFHAWTEQQARLLRQGQWAEADMEHIAEELDTLGASERRELESRLKVLLLHLLKWQYQPDQRSSSWIGTIDEQRDQLDSLLRQSPSLRRLMSEYLDYAYPKARRGASRETGLSSATFPDTCPYAEQDVLDSEFWPDS